MYISLTASAAKPQCCDTLTVIEVIFVAAVSIMASYGK